MPILAEANGVLNIGLAGFAEPLQGLGAPVLQLDWRPPADGDRNLGIERSFSAHDSALPSSLGDAAAAPRQAHPIEIMAQAYGLA